MQAAGAEIPRGIFASIFTPYFTAQSPHVTMQQQKIERERHKTMSLIEFTTSRRPRVLRRINQISQGRQFQPVLVFADPRNPGTKAQANRKFVSNQGRRQEVGVMHRPEKMGHSPREINSQRKVMFCWACNKVRGGGGPTPL